MVDSFAGSDTTASAIRATILGLLQNPDTMKSLVAEIDEAVKSGKYNTGPGQVISEAQGKEMPYLQSVIKEVSYSDLSFALLRLTAHVSKGLRWYPPAAGFLGKEVSTIISGYLGSRILHANPFSQVPPQGDTVDGYFLPGGTLLGYVHSSSLTIPHAYVM